MEFFGSFEDALKHAQIVCECYRRRAKFLKELAI